MDLNLVIERQYSRFNTEDILNSLIEMQYCTRKDVDLMVPFAEYLVTRLVGYNVKGAEEDYTWNEYLEIEKCKEVFLKPDTIELFAQALQMVDRSDEEKEDFLKGSIMSMKGKIFRGDAYLFQLVKFANKLYSPLDSEFLDKLGFTYTTFESLCFHIYKEYALRVRAAFKKRNRITNILKTLWKTIKNKEKLVNVSVKEGKIFRLYKKDLYGKYNENEINSIFSMLSLDLGEINCSEYKLGEFTPLYSKPFIDCGEYVYLPLPTSTFLNLPKIFHYTFIASKLFDKETIEKYKKIRGDVVEKLTKDYFGKYFDSSHIYQSLKYPTNTEKYEADITIQDSISNIFCECKSKMLRLPTLQGNLDTLKDDIQKAIGYAYDQASRTIEWVDQNGEFANSEGNIIKIESAINNYIVCVTPENFGNIPFEAGSYIGITHYPIVINIYDLEIVTNECRTKQELLDYFEFRILNSEILSSFDELDILGM